SKYTCNQLNAKIGAHGNQSALGASLAWQPSIRSVTAPLAPSPPVNRRHIVSQHTLPTFNTTVNTKREATCGACSTGAPVLTPSPARHPHGWPYVRGALEMARLLEAGLCRGDA